MMKKFTLVIIAVIIAVSFASAQSYSLSYEGEPVEDTVLIVGDPADLEMAFHAILTNNSDDTDTIKLQRRFISILDGVLHFYCWGQCYAPNPDSIFISPGYLVLESGQSTLEGEFSAHYEPHDVIGISLVEYTFFNKNDEEEKTTVVVKFKTSPEGISDALMVDGSVSDIYPNPATTQINIDFKLTPVVETASFQLVNILGAVVKNVEIEKNTTNLRLDVSDLTSGVYFYSVILNNDVYKTKKLIVK